MRKITGQDNNIGLLTTYKGLMKRNSDEKSRLRKTFSASSKLQKASCFNPEYESLQTADKRCSHISKSVWLKGKTIVDKKFFPSKRANLFLCYPNIYHRSYSDSTYAIHQASR